MGKFFFRILRIFGWKIDNRTPVGVDKAVVVVGPHTSNWDFVIGKIAFAHYRVNARFLIKKDLFFFPLGIILKAMGGVPVDRKKKNKNITEQAVTYFKNNEKCFLVFTPEGTRSYQPHWKRGFYYIAQNAGVPIYIAYIDYKRKTGGFHSLFVPTGDIDADIRHIKGILSEYTGKVPENGIRKED
ncbi:1-acyl-sn-glycerol-3-phosphate acyltransferase [Fluviicola sp.]|jgi:1-acyl-sn-glycerol-3-phosphate acyltransferase|uniref:1-acyl-sn-glycerol-3-phosphate acyltransferase n=1 Tax=Fluviicola sp. TaxID=1917219 RepID=UPI0028205194|nr:1-acyl-sn-glycerol-3-phosphate acyltransferase [Fluviicola sp.]MDR0801860.1 1-acyl-sn-glycerol-3-phosphate acyltransferase [Fluviicola sp.]